MPHEIPDDPGFDIDPDALQLMSELDQAMQNGDWTIAQAEQAIADSEWGRTANETDLIALGGLLNALNEPNEAVTEAKDIIDRELDKVTAEQMRDILLSLASFILGRVAPEVPEQTMNKLAAYRKARHLQRKRRIHGSPFQTDPSKRLSPKRRLGGRWGQGPTQDPPQNPQA